MHGRRVLGVRPARNALIAMRSQSKHLIYIPILAPTKCTMHGRRVFDVQLSLDHVFSVIHCSDQAEFHTSAASGTRASSLIDKETS
jgi:hypothetical protein